jgi:hypothetical protein
MKPMSAANASDFERVTYLWHTRHDGGPSWGYPGRPLLTADTGAMSVIRTGGRGERPASLSMAFSLPYYRSHPVPLGLCTRGKSNA